MSDELEPQIAPPPPLDIGNSRIDQIRITHADASDPRIVVLSRVGITQSFLVTETIR